MRNLALLDLMAIGTRIHFSLMWERVQNLHPWLLEILSKVVHFRKGILIANVWNFAPVETPITLPVQYLRLRYGYLLTHRQGAGKVKVGLTVSIFLINAAWNGFGLSS